MYLVSIRKKWFIGTRVSTFLIRDAVGDTHDTEYEAPHSYLQINKHNTGCSVAQLVVRWPA